MARRLHHLFDRVRTAIEGERLLTRRPGATRLAAALGVAGFLLAGSQRAEATYSIVAADTATRQVGGAAASCLDGFDILFAIYGSVPGRGVVHAQALPGGGRDRAIELLAEGTAPVDIIAAITAPAFDGNIARMRQYGVADLEGRVAAHTGTETYVYAGDRQGMSGSFVYSVQGNTITGETVLTQMAAAFESGACDLAERLMLALDGGALGGGGDNRCTPDGIPSDSAFIQVDREGEPAGSYLKLQVPSSSNVNPMPELRALFDEWRASHPCPMAGGSGGAGSGTGPAGGAAGSSSPREDDGCSCRTAPRGSTPGPVLWGILAFALVVSRRWNLSAHRC